jgi:hypothetical protein
MSEESSTVVTRIYINEEGDLLVTDLWDEVYQMFFSRDAGGDIVIKDQNL